MALITAARVIELAFKNDESIGIEHFTDSYIETIELVYIRPYFQQVFDNIIEKEGIGYTALETTLVSKFELPLAIFCKHDIIPELSLQLGNAGVQEFSSEFSAPTSAAGRASLQTTIMQHAEVLMNNVVRWYDDQDDLTSEETEENNDFNGDIVL